MCPSLQTSIELFKLILNIDIMVHQPQPLIHRIVQAFFLPKIFINKQGNLNVFTGEISESYLLESRDFFNPIIHNVWKGLKGTAEFGRFRFPPKQKFKAGQ